MYDAAQSKFGPGVIGEEAARINAAFESAGRTHFGPGVLGEEEAKAEADKAQASEHALSIREMVPQLEANPVLFEQFFLAEMSRPLPRKKAMEVLLKHQKGLPAEKQLPEAIALLEAKLAPTPTEG